MSEDKKDGGLFGGIRAAIDGALFEPPVDQAEASSEEPPAATTAQVPSVISLTRRSLANKETSEAKVNEHALAEINSLAPEIFVSFQKILNGLTTVIPDENSRLQAALVALNAQNIMTESIFASFDVYLAAIDDYDRDFKAALADEKEAKDSTLNGEIAELNTSIVGIESDLKTLQASLDALQRQRDGKQAILVADATRFDSLSSSVGGTIASTKQKILADKAKISPKT